MVRFKRRTTLGAWTLLCALLIPLLVACGGPTTTPGGASAAPSTAAASTPASASAAPSAPASEASPPEASTAASPSAEASSSVAAQGSGQPSPINDKVFIAAFNQAPDTLFGLELQSSVTANVLWATGGCFNQLSYDFQPTYCFKDFPTFENGQAVTKTVTIDPSTINADNAILVDGNLVTDTAAAEQAGIKIPTQLVQVTTTWKLNPDLTWEDGVPVMSADYAESIRIQKDRSLQATTRYLIDRTAQVATPDPQTIVQTMIPGYLDNTYYTDWQGLAPAHKYKGKSIADVRNAESTHPFSFGPYMVKSYTPNESVELVSNPYFAKQPKIGTVIWKFVADSDQLLAQIESGEIDYAGTIGLGLNQTEQLNQLEQDGKIKAAFVPGTTWERIDFGLARADGQPPFFDDVRVRQAVAYAINRQEIIDQVLFGKTKVMNTYVPSEHPSFPKSGLEAYAYNPEKARQLLDQAGWKPGPDGVRQKGDRKFSTTFYTTQGNRLRQATSEIIQQNLKQVGIDIKLEFVDGPAVLFKNGADGLLIGRRFDMALAAWTSGVVPSHLLYRSDQIPTAENGYSGQNNVSYNNPEFDKAATAALTELNRDKRIQYDQQAETIWNKDIPAFPLYQRLQVAAWNPAVTGIKIDPTSPPDLYNIEDIDINK